MTWTVDLVPNAEQELADAWLNAPDRNAVMRVSHALDLRLRKDPEHDGESRTHGRRIIFEAPLGAIYRALPEQLLVQVLHVWRF